MAWNDLSIAQRSQLINTFRHNGVSSLSEMKRLYDLYSPIEGNVDTYNTTTAPMYAEGGQIPPQGGYVYEEDNPQFVGPVLPKSAYNGPEVPYGFYDAPIDWERKKALQHYNESSFKANQKSPAGGNLFWPGGNIVNAVKNAARKVINPEARLAESYSSKKYTFDEAYKDARSKGQRTFFWNGNYYNTDYEGQHGRQYAQDVLSGKAAAFEAAYPGFTNPELRKEKQEELDTYGITNEQTQNKNIVSKRLLDNIDPYGNYDLAQAIDAVVLNHKQRKTDPISQANNETHIAQLRNYLGYPAEPIKLTTPKGAPVKISKYTPTVGNSQEGKYYYTFKRNPFGYQPQNPERYLSEYERLKSVGDKYLSGQFYEDARKHGLDYATKIADENTQAWSDYYDNHRDEIKGYGPLEPAFKITQETGSKEQRRSYGNAGGLGYFAVYNNPTYSSFYDLWDIGIGQGNNTNTFGVGKPFEYYDRHYHNPAEEPDIDKLYAEFSTGGKIHIKKKNRGKFTALKERTGKSASWFKAHGTPAQKKMATFELNARHWKHSHGGIKF